MGAQVLWIGLAGAVGAVTRYAIAGWTQSVFFSGLSAAVFPWGTLAVNVTGCLLMGVLAPLLIDRSLLRPELRTAILVGFVGAYTTWSTFGYETVNMLNDGQWGRAVANILATNLACLGGLWLAHRLMTI